MQPITLEPMRMILRSHVTYQKQLPNLPQITPSFLKNKTQMCVCVCVMETYYKANTQMKSLEEELPPDKYFGPYM